MPFFPLSPLSMKARKALRAFCFVFQDNTHPPTHSHFSERIHFFALPQNSAETFVNPLQFKDEELKEITSSS